MTRHILDGATGKAVAVEETLEIPVKAGWKEGTRVTFEGEQRWAFVGWVGGRVCWHAVVEQARRLKTLGTSRTQPPPTRTPSLPGRQGRRAAWAPPPGHCVRGEAGPPRHLYPRRQRPGGQGACAVDRLAVCPHPPTNPPYTLTPRAQVRIPLAKALGGGTVDVPSLDGRVLRVPLKEVVTPGYERVVKGEGMPVSKAPGTKGDLRLRFDLAFPRRQLGEGERAQLEAMLADKY